MDSRDFESEIYKPMMSYKKGKNFKFMIRYILIITELLKAVGRHELAAKCYLWVAKESTQDPTIITPLLYE